MLDRAASECRRVPARLGITPGTTISRQQSAAGKADKFAQVVHDQGAQERILQPQALAPLTGLTSLEVWAVMRKVGAAAAMLEKTAPGSNVCGMRLTRLA